MAVLKKDQSQSTHWYKADGSPCHRLPRAGGDGLRPTTLRDAKRLRLFPGVTSILGIFAKPQLDKWKMRQVALASMCLDRTEGESDDYFADRIIEEAFAQVEQAADLGSRIHEALRGRARSRRFDRLHAAGLRLEGGEAVGVRRARAMSRQQGPRLCRDDGCRLSIRQGRHRGDRLQDPEDQAGRGGHALRRAGDADRCLRCDLLGGRGIFPVSSGPTSTFRPRSPVA